MNTRSLHRAASSASVRISALLILLLLMAGCTDSNSWQKAEGMIWHTVWHTTYYGSQDMINEAMDSLKSVEASISVFDSNSLISKINEAEYGPVDMHLINVYNMAKKVNHASNGMFDPTISRIITAWGFGKDHTANADTDSIQQILKSVGIDKTYIQNGYLYKERPDITFNFSAIAKGYGVDVAADVLRKNGCKDLMLEIGGEIVCYGLNPDGRKWRILIETPDEEFLKEVFNSDNMPTFSEPLIVELDNEALATSGNYRNYRKKDGQTYGHTISPRTGYPITSDILSASVIASTCMEADAMATACMTLGSSDALAMLIDNGLAGALILNSGEVLVNDMMRQHIVKNTSAMK